MTLPTMLAVLPPAWLERYEKVKQVKPHELLEEFEKVKGKNYGRQKVLRLLFGLASMMLVSSLFYHNGAQKETLGEYIAKIVSLLFISLLTWWWVDRSADAEAARSDLVRQLDKIRNDIQALIDLVGGDRWLNDHGIKGAMIRLAGEVVTQEKFLVKIAKKVGDGDLELVYKIQTCAGNLNSMEKAYERASNLIRRFVNPPFEFERAKELAREALQIGEPDTADK